MEIELKHPFILRCLDLNDLFTDCQDLKIFMSKVTKQSVMSMDENKYKGDSLELLGEALIKLSPVDKRIGVFNYSPVLDNDHGVDGFGTGFNLKPATVQFKWRIPTAILTANTDHLSNFVMSSYREFDVDVKDNENMLIITTAKDLHHYTDAEMFGGQVRTINYDLLKQLVDGNLSFWQLFKETVLAAKSNFSPKI